MTEFTASNGVIVTERDGYLRVQSSPGASPYIGSGFFGVALNEYMDHLRDRWRHEEDERLGRMRVDGYPDWFVVWAYVGSAVYVCSDRMPAAGGVLVSRSEVDDRDTNEHDIARAFFDAHPEPKPAWHDAKPGEVWAVSGGGENAFRFNAWVLESGAFMFDDESFIFADAITAGHRIWPPKEES